MFALCLSYETYLGGGGLFSLFWFNSTQFLVSFSQAYVALTDEGKVGHRRGKSMPLTRLLSSSFIVVLQQCIKPDGIPLHPRKEVMRPGILQSFCPLQV